MMIKSKRSHKTDGFFVLLLIVLLCYMIKSVLNESIPEDLLYNAPVFIQLDGDIKLPGVYSAKSRSTLLELIERAGGLATHRDNPGVLKGIIIPSGSKVTIRIDTDGLRFSRSEMSAFYKITLGIPISLNGESELGLTAIPGIGPGRAGAIIRERSGRGRFNSLDEMMDIKGINEGLFRKIRPYLIL